MSTPYITPDMITNAPTGVPWDIIPFPQATTAQQRAEQANICWRASAEVDSLCNQPVRASLDSETLQGPDMRLTVDASGVGRAVTSRWPVLQVLGGRVSPRAVFPRQWTAIPADRMAPEQPAIGVYGTSAVGGAGSGGAAILIAPGFVSWAAGRSGATVELFFINGWPHTGLTVSTPGGTTVTVDDVTGFAGATAFLYDGEVSEQVQIVSVTADQAVTVPGGDPTPTGPGTLTLAAACQPHGAGVVISALPQDIPWAAMLLASAQVLESGVSAVTIQSLPGAVAGSSRSVESLRSTAQALLAPYRRVI